MNASDPRVLIGVGLALMLVGFLLPALMIVKVIENSFLLSFISYGASFVGFSMGMLGVVMLVIRRRRGD